MGRSIPTMVQQISQAVTKFQKECTGHAPKSASVLLGGEILVVTMHEALSPAEKTMSRTPEGAARVSEFHRQLFQTASGTLNEQLKIILGVEVREAAMELESIVGHVSAAFPSGTLVQVFHLSQTINSQS